VAGYIERTARNKIPRKFYYFTKDYLEDRKAEIAINRFSKEKNINKAARKGLAIAQGYGTSSSTHF